MFLVNILWYALDGPCSETLVPFESYSISFDEIWESVRTDEVPENPTAPVDRIRTDLALWGAETISLWHIWSKSQTVCFGRRNNSKNFHYNSLYP
jgi:hypothetical protein